LLAPEQDTGLFARLISLIREAASRIRNTPISAPMTSRLSAPPAGQMWKTYYYAGSQLIALRVLTQTGNTLYYLHSDHLGSTSLTTDSSGNVTARQNYYPYGAIRSGGGMPTDVGYTGQRLDATGLMHYGARYYSSYLNRWISPDTIVPDPKNPQQLNRLAYVLNNPIKHTDPTGHCIPGETCRAPKPPARPPQGPPQPPPPQPPQPQQAPTVGGWTLMLREMNKSIVGAELLGLIPDDTAFGWSPFVSKGRMAQFYGHLVVAPHGFDPASSLDPASVGVLSHELTHVLQRIVHRDGMCDNCTTLYSETEANIIGWTIKYDLTTDQNERQLIKGNLQFATGPLAPMYDWLRQQGFPYDRSGEWTFGTGDWRDTLPQLGFSQATVQHIVDIINQP
jgi:RHS repeat-associated protein